MYQNVQNCQLNYGKLRSQHIFTIEGRARWAISKKLVFGAVMTPTFHIAIAVFAVSARIRIPSIGQNICYRIESCANHPGEVFFGAAGRWILVVTVVTYSCHNVPCLLSASLLSPNHNFICLPACQVAWVSNNSSCQWQIEAVLLDDVGCSCMCFGRKHWPVIFCPKSRIATLTKAWAILSWLRVSTMQLHQAPAASKMTSVEYFPLECGGKSQFLEHGPPNHSRRQDDRETRLVV